MPFPLCQAAAAAAATESYRFSICYYYLYLWFFLLSFSCCCCLNGNISNALFDWNWIKFWVRLCCRCCCCWCCRLCCCLCRDTVNEFVLKLAICKASPATGRNERLWSLGWHVRRRLPSSLTLPPPQFLFHCCGLGKQKMEPSFCCLRRRRRRSFCARHFWLFWRLTACLLTFSIASKFSSSVVAVVAAAAAVWSVLILDSWFFSLQNVVTRPTQDSDCRSTAAAGAALIFDVKLRDATDAKSVPTDKVLSNAVQFGAVDSVCVFSSFFPF